MKIAILDAKTLGSDVDLSGFSRYGEVAVHATTPSEERFSRVKGADIVVTNKVVIDKEIMDHAPGLKLICISATGTDHVDLEYARTKGIAVANVAGYSTRSVAQHTFAILLYLLESLNYYDEYVKSGQYARNDMFTHIGRPFSELDGKRWGIIGLGKIGREVAKIATAFGCEVVHYSTSGKNLTEEFRNLSLEELLKSSDIVSIHAPLNEKTKYLIGYSQLKWMKPAAILINVGRGGIVNEKDLAQALDEGLLHGAGLDVLEKEPIAAENPLLKIKEKEKLLITPHIAWTSIEARKRLVDEILLNIEAYLKGPMRNRVV